MQQHSCSCTVASAGLASDTYANLCARTYIPAAEQQNHPETAQYTEPLFSITTRKSVLEQHKALPGIVMPPGKHNGMHVHDPDIVTLDPDHELDGDQNLTLHTHCKDLSEIC